MKELESAFAILLYVIVFGSPVWIPLAIYVYHQRKNPPVQVMSIEALMAAAFQTRKPLLSSEDSEKKQGIMFVRQPTLSEQESEPGI